MSLEDLLSVPEKDDRPAGSWDECPIDLHCVGHGAAIANPLIVVQHLDYYSIIALTELDAMYARRWREKLP